MLAGQYPIRSFVFPNRYEPVQASIYTNSVINNLYLQFSATLGQLGSLVSNSLIQGKTAKYNSYVDYLIMSLYYLRNWYNGGFILPNIPNNGTISAYWVQTNTSVLTNVPLFQNVNLGATTPLTASNIQAVLPEGCIASVYDTNEIYVESQYTKLKTVTNAQGTFTYAGMNYIYWVIVSGLNTYTGWSMIDYLPVLFYEQAASIINKCKLIQTAVSLSELQFDNAYVSLGQPAQALIPNPSLSFNWLNQSNGVSVTDGITIFEE